MNKKVIALLSCSTLFPGLAGAVMISPTPGGSLTLMGIINLAVAFIWPLFIGFAVIMFIIAGFKFLSAQGEPEGVKDAQKSVMWGVVGVVVGVLAFSIPFLIQNFITYGPPPPTTPPTTCVPLGQSCASNPNCCAGGTCHETTTPGSPLRAAVCVRQ